MMTTVEPLAPAALYRRCDPAKFSFATSPIDRRRVANRVLDSTGRSQINRDFGPVGCGLDCHWPNGIAIVTGSDGEPVSNGQAASIDCTVSVIMRNRHG